MVENMIQKHIAKRMFFIAFAISVSLALFSVPPGYAGSGAIGVIAGSEGTTVGNFPAPGNTSLFSGDRLQVTDHGVAFVKLARGGEVVLGKGTVASFYQAPSALDVSLEQVNVTVSHPGEGQILRVRVGDFSIEPVNGERAAGAVTLQKQNLFVTTTEGRLRVEGLGIAAEATPGKPVELSIAKSSFGTGVPASGAVHVAGKARARMIAGVGAIGAGAITAGASLASRGSLASARTTSNALAMPHLTNGSTGATPLSPDSEGKSHGHSPKGSPQGPPTMAGPPLGHNPIAIGHVGSVVPPEACEHAASPSVPAVACASNGQ